MIANMQYGQRSRASRCSQNQAGFMFGETWRRICDDLGSNSAGPVITLNGTITASDYMGILGNQVLPVVQMFPNNDAVFQGDNLPIHTARNVQSWFEEHEIALQHLP